MPRTRADLIVEVLDILNVTQTGQDPAAEDVQKVDEKIDGVFARLSRRSVVYVQDANAIEDEFFDPLAIIVANRVGPKFGQPYDASTDLREEASLRSMQKEPGISETVPALYY